MYAPISRDWSWRWVWCLVVQVKRWQEVASSQVISSLIALELSGYSKIGFTVGVMASLLLKWWKEMADIPKTRLLSRGLMRLCIGVDCAAAGAPCLDRLQMVTINPCRSPIIMCYFLNSLNVALAQPPPRSNLAFISISTDFENGNTPILCSNWLDV